MGKKSSRRGKPRTRRSLGGRLPLALAVVFLVIAALVLLRRTPTPTDEDVTLLPEVGDRRVPAQEAAPPAAEPVQPAALPSPDAVEMRADRLVERLRQALNDGDVDVLAELSAIPPEAPDDRAAEAALQDYRRFFGGGPVVRSVRSRSESGQTSQGEDARIVYELVGENGSRKPVLAYFDARIDSVRIYDEFLRYSGRIHAFAGAIVEAVRAGDAAQLADLLSVDDVQYPVTSARQAIERYDERFDRSTLRLSFSGLAPEGATEFNRPFLFTLRGEKHGQPATHLVRIHAADGLLNWHDSLVSHPSD